MWYVNRSHLLYTSVLLKITEIIFRHNNNIQKLKNLFNFTKIGSTTKMVSNGVFPHRI